MVNLCMAYFNDLMSKGHVEVCHGILSPGVEHKDMVRPMGGRQRLDTLLVRRSSACDGGRETQPGEAERRSGLGQRHGARWAGGWASTAWHASGVAKPSPAPISWLALPRTLGMPAGAERGAVRHPGEQACLIPGLPPRLPAACPALQLLG